MGYTPKQNTYSKPEAVTAAQSTSAAPATAKTKVPIAGSLHVTAQGEQKGQRLCNLFLNEKNGKKWLSGKTEDGTRFSIFLNDPE